MKKILDIEPEHIRDYGDCQSAILYKLFEYYNIPHFEVLFTNDGHVAYTPTTNVDVPFDMNKLFRLPISNYFMLLEEQYNIRTLNKKCSNISGIIDSIDKGDPVILNGRSADMPWRPCDDIREVHSCVIIGYDTDKELLICIDPIFEPGFLELPYENVQLYDEKTKLQLLDFKYLKQDIQYNLNELPDYFKSFDGRENSWDCYIKLCTDILKKNAVGKLFDFNYHNYLLGSVSWFYWISRNAKIYMFFSYLYREYKDDKYLRMQKLAYESFLTIKNACSLVIQFSQTGDNMIIFKVVEKILESGEYERQIFNIIMGYDD